MRHCIAYPVYFAVLPEKWPTGFARLKNIDEVIVEVQSSKIKVVFKKFTFSIIGYAGKTGRKCFLVINTDTDPLCVRRFIHCMTAQRATLVCPHFVAKSSQ